jgi:two-component system OmpR family sensor kinase
VDNAVKFSPAGGQVTIRLSRDAGSVEVLVEDQGPGIPADDLPNIFERYYRGAQRGSRTAGGAGIGLSISRWIARAHGGDIRAENSPSGGSRFTVILPAAREEAQLAATPR